MTDRCELCGALNANSAECWVCPECKGAGVTPAWLGNAIETCKACGGTGEVTDG